MLMLLHAFAFAVTLTIGAFAIGVIHHMVRTYWRKAHAALLMEHVPGQEIAR
ncbi:MAG: hypothetical protein AB7E05_09235 [Sphingobium sp.]